VCYEAKDTRNPSRQIATRAQAPLELLHTDPCAPFEIPTIGGAKYMLLITDDYTRYSTVYFLKQKSETKGVFLKHIAQAENQLSLPAKRFRSDNGGEYISNIPRFEP
jgi:transposase InsO family protein